MIGELVFGEGAVCGGAASGGLKMIPSRCRTATGEVDGRELIQLCINKATRRGRLQPIRMYCTCIVSKY